MEHPARSNAFTRATILAVAAFVGGFAVFVAMTVAGVDQQRPVPQAIAKGVVLLWLASVAYSLWTYIALRIYRCPACGGKTETVADAYPAIHKYCAACNVEWATGLSHSQSLD
jgi:hypothetical protein